MSQEKVDKIYKVTADKIEGFFGPHRFLSNYHESQLYVLKKLFFSSEAAYQAGKSLDKKIQESFTSLSPNEAKKEGQKIIIRPDWDSVKLSHMYNCLVSKFKDPELKELLLNTENKYLEETNWWGDKFWGVYEGEGLNWLGRLLMLIRSQLYLKKTQ